MNKICEKRRLVYKDFSAFVIHDLNFSVLKCTKNAALDHLCVDTIQHVTGM